MAGDDLYGDMSKFERGLEKMNRLMTSLAASADKFGKSMSGASQSATKSAGTGFGSRQLGVGQTNMMSGSMGNVPQFLDMNRRMNTAGGVIGGAMQMMGGVVAAGAMAMPDYGVAMGRATGYYNSAVIGGLNSGQMKRMRTQTMNLLGNGMTSIGSDVTVNNNLVGAGVIQGSQQYNQQVTATANAQRYLNIDNDTASRAIAGLNTGGFSAGLMKNAGIFTTDPMTGKRKTATAIFSEINDRMLQGATKKVTREGLQSDFQAGIITENLNGLGITDPVQQQMAFQYMLDSADGKAWDINSKASTEELMKSKGIENPNQAYGDMAQASTKTMEAATDAYVQGTKDAAEAVKAFQGVLESFIKSPVGQAAARGFGALEGMSTPNAGGMGQAIMTGASNILGGAMAIGGTMLAARFLKGKGIGNILGTSGKAQTGAGNVVGNGRNAPKGSIYDKKAGNWKDPKTGKVVKDVNKGTGKAGWSRPSAAGGAGAFKGAVKSGLKVGGALSLLGLAMDAEENNQAAEQGYGGSAWGESIGSAVGSTALGALGFAIPVPGLNIVAGIGLGMLGGWLGGMAGKAIGSNFDTAGRGGDGNANGTGGTTDTSSVLKLIHPTSGKITSRYGSTAGRDHAHRGIDYGVAIGTAVRAAAAGKVTAIGNGHGKYSFGKNIRVRHATGHDTLYCHLSAFKVSVGDTVTQGQLIALSGNTGYSTGPHLHFQLEKGGAAINPHPFLGGGVASATETEDKSASNSKGSTTSSTGKSGASGGGGGANTRGYVEGKMTSGGGPSSYKGGGSSGGYAAASGSGAPTGNSLGQGVSTTAGAGVNTGGMGGDTPLSMGPRNNVTINLTINDASDIEARRFANKVKEYLDERHSLTSIGRM